MDGDDASSTENFQSEYRKRVRICDILVDFQTGGNFPVLVGYIYKFVTKCDGAVGRIVPCVLNGSIIMILYHGNYGRTWNSEITKNEEDSCLDSIIRRVVVIHTSPTQFIWKKSIQN